MTLTVYHGGRAARPRIVRTHAHHPTRRPRAISENRRIRVYAIVPRVECQAW